VFLDDYPAATAIDENSCPRATDDVRHVARREMGNAIGRSHDRRIAGEDVDVHRRPFPFRVAHVAADVFPERFDL